MSNKHKQLNIGLFGFGVVGTGLYQVLEQTPGLNARIKKICIKDPNKQREAPAHLFTTDAAILLNDPEINVIVELIDDAGAAYHIVTAALKSSKAAVSANKKMIASHLEELIALQVAHKAPLLYEAACCASIPVIRNLEEYYDNDLLHSIFGIVNGSTNYILTKIAEEKLSFASALKNAQEAGFAESNPALDVEGIDAANKLCILLAHAYGTLCLPQQLLHTGIQHLTTADAQYAKEKGYTIKLIAQAGKLSNGQLAAFVAPQFVEKASQLFAVRNEYNGVVIESSFADRQFFYGKGAGSHPTASAVLSDISALRYNYQYEYKKYNSPQPQALSADYHLKVRISCDSTSNIPRERFAHILSWSNDEEGNSYVVGIVHFQELIGNDWWKTEGRSLILLPNCIIDKPIANKRAPSREINALAIE